MRGTKSSLSVILATSLVAGSAVGVTAQDTDEGGSADGAEAMRPAMVTGTLLIHNEDGEQTGRVETNDHRLNGDITSEVTFEDFPDVLLPEDAGPDADRVGRY